MKKVWYLPTTDEANRPLVIKVRVIGEKDGWRMGHDVMSVARMESIIGRISAAAHNNPTCINCVAVEKWKSKQAAAKAKKEADHD